MIYIVVAMQEEAESLIQILGLSKLKGTLFSVYSGGGVRLVISGYGKVHSAAAVTALALTPGHDKSNIWINIGLAGSACYQVGTWVSAGQVIDQSSQRKWCLQPLNHPNIPLANLVTVDRVEHNYQGNTVYDMEASGFVMMARRIAPLKHVMCFKLISDSPQQPAKQLSKIKLSTLVESKIDQILALIKEIAATRGK